MKRIFYILVLFLPALISCEREFDITDLKASPKLYIESIFHDRQDTVEIIVKPTYPVNENPSQYSYPSDLKVYVLEDGEERVVEKADVRFDDHQYKWFVTGRFRPGVKVEIKAEATGYPDVQSSVEVPEPFNDFSCSVEKYSDNLDLSILHIDYADDPHSNDYYAVSVMNHTKVVYFDGTVFNESSYCRIHFPESDDFGEYDYTAYNAAGKGWSPERILVFWCDSDSSSKGKQRKSIYIREKQTPDLWEWTEPMFGGEGEVVGTVYDTFYVTLYKLSSQTYHYLNGEWNRKYNDFVYLGLAPATFTYTNISGGIGIFGPMAASEPYPIDWSDYQQ